MAAHCSVLAWRIPDAAIGTFAILGRSGDVVCIAGETIADDFGIDFGATCLFMFQFFENDNAGALAHDETVTVAVIGARCLLRIVIVLGGQRLDL